MRRLLGEQLIDIRRSEDKLAKVTTPSLQALQLYTRADLLLQASARAEGAEELLRQAIEKDRRFASAYIHLAWTLRRRDRACLEECLSNSQRAVELADTASDSERYFILGSHHWFREELDESEANYRALLQIDPGHTWALTNLTYLLQSSGRRDEDLLPLYQLRAEMAPNSFSAYAAAAHHTLRFRSLEEAEPYLTRAMELEPEDGEPWYWVAFVQARRANKAWLEEDLDGLLERIDEWARPRTKRSARLEERLVIQAGDYSVGVGRLRAAQEIYRQLPDEESPTRQRSLRRIELERADPEHQREVLQRWPIESPGETVFEAWLLARAGLVAEARAILDSWSPDKAPVAQASVGLAARAEVALAEGRAEDAIPLLQKALPPLASWPGSYYFGASEALARAWEQEGSAQNALRVLEEASAQKTRAGSGIGGWMDVQLHLARLYRELGREAKAREIEAEQRRLLVYADRDFRILRQLERQSQSADAAPNR